MLFENIIFLVLLMVLILVFWLVNNCCVCLGIFDKGILNVILICCFEFSEGLKLIGSFCI